MTLYRNYATIHNLGRKIHRLVGEREGKRTEQFLSNISILDQASTLCINLMSSPTNNSETVNGQFMFRSRFCNMGRVTPAKPEIDKVGPSEKVGATS